MSENNNGLNDFNKKQIGNRQSRVRRRNIQRIAVLTVFLVLMAILIAVLWLVILDIKENIENRLPGDETSTPLSTGDQTEPPAITNKPEDTETDPVVSNTETTPSDTSVSYPTISKVYAKSQIYQGSLLLIDEDHPFVTSSDIASKLTTIREVRNSRPKVTVDGKSNYSLYFMAQYVEVDGSIVNKLLDMADACYTETKINDLCISTNGAYRTYDTQKDMYDKNLTSVPAGCSDFNSGLSVYFVGYPDSGGNPALDEANYANGAVLAEWLENNAYKYGFIKRHTSAKVSVTGQPEDVGHYRYVGYPHSYIMNEQNLCLEEYIIMISQYTANGEHYLVTAEDGHTYEIYYVASEGDITNVTVPASLPYTVSGDNYSGFIVTVTLD